MTDLTWTMHLDRYEDTPDGLHNSREWYTFGADVSITPEERAPYAHVDQWARPLAISTAREEGAHEHDQMFMTVKDHNGQVVYEFEFWMPERENE